jgi:hypothetical protein
MGLLPVFRTQRQDVPALVLLRMGTSAIGIIDLQAEDHALAGMRRVGRLFR